MRLKEYILNESTYGKNIKEHLRPYRKGEHYVIFSNEELPKQKKFIKSLELEGIVGYPVKFVFNTLAREETLNIPKWVGKEYLIIASPLKGKILNVQEYNANPVTFEKNIKTLEKFYMSNIPPTIKNPEMMWERITMRAARKNPKEVFRRLISMMHQIYLQTDYTLNALFQNIGFAGIYSNIGFDSLKTNNPELVILNYRNLKRVKVIEND